MLLRRYSCYVGSHSSMHGSMQHYSVDTEFCTRGGGGGGGKWVKSSAVRLNNTITGGTNQLMFNHTVILQSILKSFIKQKKLVLTRFIPIFIGMNIMSVFLSVHSGYS